MLSLSTTGVADAAACLKKYQYHMVDKIISRPENISRPIRRGIWLHRCLQDLHTGKDWGVSLNKLCAQTIGWNLDGTLMQDIYDECRLLILGYIEHYYQDNWRPIAVEQEYRAVFGDVELRATIDLLADIDHHGVVLVEHKSTSDIPPAAWRAVDPQTAMQVIILAANGIQVDELLFNYINTTPTVPRVTNGGEFYKLSGVTTEAHFDAAADIARTTLVKNVLTNVANPFVPDVEEYIRQKRAELVDNPKFYQRFYTSRQPELLRETIQDLAGIADRIMRAEARGHYPRSLNVFTCKSCFYNHAALCPTEYVKGGISEVLRTEQFQADTGYREGNVE